MKTTCTVEGTQSERVTAEWSAGSAPRVEWREFWLEVRAVWCTTRTRVETDSFPGLYKKKCGRRKEETSDQDSSGQ